MGWLNRSVPFQGVERLSNESSGSSFTTDSDHKLWWIGISTYAARACAGAKAEIEHAFEQAFREAIFAEVYEQGERGQIARDRRKAEIWLCLQEGLPVEHIFPDLPPETQAELIRNHEK